ncbi:MAG: T9SS type A sorting domain-containing protein [Bacteroidota bacterium]
MKRLIFLFTLFLTPNLSIACSCAGPNDFCVILPNAIEAGSLVVRGYPVRTIGHGMEFKIEELVAGTENRSQIIVWGDPGYLCRTYVTGFTQEDELLMILAPINRERKENVTGETERVGDYELSVCGQFFVYLNGANRTDVDCYKPFRGKPNRISVFPNPSSDYFSLVTTGSIEPSDLIQINVFNSNGQLIYRRGQLAIRQKENNVEILTNNWIDGLYLVEIRTPQNRWIAKVVVSR